MLQEGRRTHPCMVEIVDCLIKGLVIEENPGSNGEAQPGVLTSGTLLWDRLPKVSIPMEEVEGGTKSLLDVIRKRTICRSQRDQV